LKARVENVLQICYILNNVTIKSGLKIFTACFILMGSTYSTGRNFIITKDNVNRNTS